MLYLLTIPIFWDTLYTHQNEQLSDLYLFININIELLDTLQCQLLFLHQNPNWISHKLCCYLQHICGHCGRQQDDLEEIQFQISMFCQQHGSLLSQCMGTLTVRALPDKNFFVCQYFCLIKGEFCLRRGCFVREA